MSKKLLKFIENQFANSPKLVEQFGDKVKDKAKEYYDSIMADDDGEVDPTNLVMSIFSTHKNAIHKEFEPHFKGQFANVNGRELARIAELDVKEISSETGNILLDKLHEKLGAKLAELKASGNSAKGNEQVEALKKQIQEVQDKYNTDKGIWEKAAKDAEAKANSYIEQSELKNNFLSLVKQAYNGTTLREGISFETLAEDYPLLAERAGIVYKVVNGKVEARQKDNPEAPYLIDGINNLDPVKHIRNLMDTKYTPVQVAGKSFDTPPAGTSGGQVADANDIGSAMDKMAAELFPGQ